MSALPPELAERTLALCHPRDVAAYSQTCRSAHTVVYQSSDQHLWRTLFLDYPFDDPRLSAVSPAPSEDVDWRTKLQRRVRAEKIARSDGDRREFVNVMLECLDEAAPRGDAREPSPSHNIAWATKLLALEKSPWVEKCLRLEQPEALKPLESDVERLRAQLSLALDRGIGAEAPEELRVLRRMCRAHVYDLRCYVQETNYGPFYPDSDRVNWSHVSAMITAMTMNLRDFGVHWPKEFMPPSIVHGLEASRPYSYPGSLKRSPLDWAGVEGRWMRIVSFCDYRDLMRFNNSGYNPSFFDDEYQEASRLLRLNLRITSVESDPKVLATLPDPSRPPITYGGTMRGFNSDEVLNRAVRGSVRVTEDGSIRWSYVAIYNRLDQWSSEGVQIGSVGSAAGIVGAWTGAQHEQGDPSGPFWLWRAEEKKAC